MPGLSQDGGLTLVHVTQRTVTPVPLQCAGTIIAITLNTFCQNSTYAYLNEDLL